MKSVTKQFGANLKKVRIEKNMTQGDIVRATGIDRSYVSALESGKQNPTLTTIEKIAKALGVSDLQIIYRHILPHTISYSIVAVMLSIPGYILGEAALSLIGLGIQDPIPSWGNLLSDAMSIVRIQFAPWILIPGFFIVVTVICFNVIGDALRDCLDPLLKGNHESARG